MAVLPARRHLAAVLATACVGIAVSAAPGTALAQPADRPHGKTRLTSAQRAVLLDATRRFRDVRQAVAAGYRPTRDCVPGMGLHYTNPGLTRDLTIDPTLPEILVYTPVIDGSVRLAALEYFRADGDGRIRTAGDRPTLFGHRFDGPMAGHPGPPGQPPMPVHYDLHVWLYQANPSGQLEPENPEVTCR